MQQAQWPALRPAQARRGAGLSALLLVLLAWPARSAVPIGDGSKYLMISLPGEAKIVYMGPLPTNTPRDLITSGMNTPTSIAFDATNNRLYIADVPDKLIYYFGIIMLADGKLISDGTQVVVANNLEANNIAVDSGGNLYITGQAKVKPPYTGLGKMAVFKHTWFKIERGKTKVTPVNGMSNGPKVYAPSVLVTDGTALYFGNSRGGADHGTVNKVGTGGGGPGTMADNEDGAMGIAVTERHVFYGTADGIFGFAKNKADSSCGKLSCRRITNRIGSACSMLWDGDGTLYIGDCANNAIWSMPSGNLEPHKIQKVGDIGDDIHSIAMLMIPGDRGGALPRGPAALALAVAGALLLRA